MKNNLIEKFGKNRSTSSINDFTVFGICVSETQLSDNKYDQHLK